MIVHNNHSYQKSHELSCQDAAEKTIQSYTKNYSVIHTKN